MPKATITIFDEEKITHKGMDPDLKVILDKISKDGIEIKLEINLKRHNFDRSAHVFFQAYNNRGAGMKPWPMGSIKDLNTSEINTFFKVWNISEPHLSASEYVSKPAGTIINSCISTLLSA